MKIDFYIKQGARVPALESRLEDAAGAIDLDGSAVALRMRRLADGSVKINNAPAFVIEDDPAQLAAGEPNVKFDWREGDTDTPGIYEAEWVVTDADGRTQRFPANARRPFVYVEVQAAA